MISERDKARVSASRANKDDMPALKAKYKQLRNRVVSQLRKDAIQRNGDRIDRAANGSETWKIVNEILKPRSPSNITIRTPTGNVAAEDEVAEEFNQFFVQKAILLQINAMFF